MKELHFEVDRGLATLIYDKDWNLYGVKKDGIIYRKDGSVPYFGENGNLEYVTFPDKTIYYDKDGRVDKIRYRDKTVHYYKNGKIKKEEYSHKTVHYISNKIHTVYNNGIEECYIDGNLVKLVKDGIEVGYDIYGNIISQKMNGKVSKYDPNKFYGVLADKYLYAYIRDNTVTINFYSTKDIQTLDDIDIKVNKGYSYTLTDNKIEKVFNNRGNMIFYRNSRGLSTKYIYKNDVDIRVSFRRFPDGTEEYYDKDEICIKRKYHDGEIELYEDGDCIYRKYSDGTEEWYDNGMLVHSKYPKNRHIYYDKDGHKIR